MENLPTDITEDILFWLPMESRLQIKPVCKTWRNLIGCKQTGLLFAFADINDDRLPKSGTEVHLCYGDRQELNPVNDEFCSNKTLTNLDSIKYSLQPLHCISDNHMVGSCNGLVCHYLNNQATKGTCGGICNPVTGETFVLPRPKRPKYVGWFVLGFGYLPSTNEYKVVRCCCELLPGGWQGYVEVCTLGCQSGWRGMENIPYKMQFMQSGLFVNGAIHWICEIGWGMCKIVAYDLSDEKFKNVSSPPSDFFKRHDGLNGRLEILGGNLCAIVYGRHEILVWALKKNIKNARILRPRSTEYYDHNWSWSKEFRIAIKDSDKGAKLYRYRPFEITKSNEVLLWYKRKKIYRYDNKTSTLTKLWERDDKTDSCLQAIPHMNTLVSLKDIVERSGNNATSDNDVRSRSKKISRKRKRRKG